jgi:isocitrate lyase
VPTGHFVRTLQAARLAADVCNVPTVLVARTDALSATLLTSDVDERDHEFITGERTPEGFFRVSDGLAPVIARMLAYAPYADVLWFETSTPELDEVLEFAPLVLRVCGIVERRTLLMQWRAVSTATGRFTAPAASCRR